jgi:peptide/nickel transport system permease protein
MGAGDEALIAEMRSSYGLDKTLFEQLSIYLMKMVQGNLGFSYYYNLPVTDLILPRVPATVLLVVSALVFAVVLGTVLGVRSSRNPNRLSSHLITVITLFGYSAPVFWIGIMLLILFGSVIPIFPISGMYDIARTTGGFPRLLDILQHLILPMVTLAILHLALYSRLSRASMLDVLGSDYIRTARAKGMTEKVVVYKHALRNAVLPIVTMTGLQMGRLFAGALVVETVFNWPGLGRLAFDSIMRRDTPTLLGLLFFSTLMVVTANLLTDLTYGLIDPRIVSGRGQKD